MSKITNDSFQGSYNSTIVTADMNTKFSDVQTATAALRSENIRDEGIDRRNITGAINIKDVEYEYSNAPNTLYTLYTRDDRTSGQDSIKLLDETGSGGSEFLDFGWSGAGVVITNTDVLRLHFSFAYTQNDLVYSPLRDDATTSGYCFIIFPAYQAPGSADWLVFPNRCDFLQYGIRGPEYNTSTTDGETVEIAYADEPANDYFDDGLAVMGIQGPRDAGINYHFLRCHGHLTLKNPTEFTIGRIGFFLTGPYDLQGAHASSVFSDPRRGFEIANGNGAAGNRVWIHYGNYGAIVMRNAS